MATRAPRQRKKAFQLVQLGLAHGAVQAQPDGLGERRIHARENGAAAGDFERRRAPGRAAERLGRLGALDAARQSQIRESQNASCDGGGQKRII